MRLIFAGLSIFISLHALAQTGTDTTLLQPVEIVAVRAADNAPVTKINISKKELVALNNGLDLPFILSHSPSVIVNSDAGNGIGYTGIRIRGTDASRINVTLNGIPYNDAESQGTFFVDMPDIASSANNIQIQRGVGTSSNGSGAFGGSINVATNEIIKTKNLEFNNAFGSFHSFKNTLIYNSGLLADHITVDARLSNIRSDGYIERAFSRLISASASIGYLKAGSSLRFNVISGKEKTYQSWYGIDEETLKNNRRFNPAGTENIGEPYSDETDNYLQTQYQAFYNKRLNNKLNAGLAVFLTNGKGYYEQYKADQQLAVYGLPSFFVGNTEILATDLVRKLWLDNAYYGTSYSLHYNTFQRKIIFGGYLASYDGKHYGELVNSKVLGAVPIGYKWYDLTAFKKEGSSYLKWTEVLSATWQTFLDMQVRAADYTINGFRNNPELILQNKYLFFNPKAGISYNRNSIRAYFAFGRGAKEPNRDDLEAAVAQTPKPEKLHDFELGIEKKHAKSLVGINLFYMLYDNQLVLTGKINDVGAYTRTNIKDSYRKGVEIQGSHSFSKWLLASANFTLSENKIKNFTEYIDDYDNGGQQTHFYPRTTLPFSPSVISNMSLQITPFTNSVLSFNSKYVSRQYLDNTSQTSRSLNPYFVQDVRISHTIKRERIKSVMFFAQVYNLFSEKYEANGYTFSYITQNKTETENYYFPMAPINVMLGINISF